MSRSESGVFSKYSYLLSPSHTFSHLPSPSQSKDGVFSKYFHAATPTAALATMNLGSRPAKRKAAGGIETLRAIPWVFAWTQTRLHLPVWLGGGAALAQQIADGQLPDLQAMYRDWPFFQGLIDLIELELSKAEPAVSSVRTAGSELAPLALP